AIRIRLALFDYGAGAGAGSTATTGGTPAFVHAVLSVKVKTRGSRLERDRVMLMRLHPIAASRMDWNQKERCLAGGAARRRRGSSDDDGSGATRLVLCLDRLPARIPHAGSGKRSYMGRGASSRLVPPSKTEHWSCRASMLGRSMLSAVGPTDATSIANNLDSRNPHVGLRTSCPDC